MCRLLTGTLSSTEGLRRRARATSRKKSSCVGPRAFLTLPVNPASLASDDRQEDTTRRALGSDQTDLAKWQSNMEGLAWTSLIFFAVEFAGMFTGVSLFMPTANAYYIFSHFFGALFVGLFVGRPGRPCRRVGGSGTVRPARHPGAPPHTRHRPAAAHRTSLTSVIPSVHHPSRARRVEAGPPSTRRGPR